ncbi:MAG: hypothetical protein U5Q44_13970 [Dehalococcoidia bacterium]|nr:hypothetical protein [Dehalococcoidia bacterium]
MTLIVSGWVAIDTVETPFEKRENMLGGSATCAALAAALFTDVRLLATVGEDFPDELRKGLEHPNLDLAGLATEPGGQTSRWHGRYSYDMNSRDTLDTQLGVNAEWSPTLPDGWEKSDTIFCAAGDPAVQKRLMTSLPNLEDVDGRRDRALPGDPTSG